MIGVLEQVLFPLVHLIDQEPLVARAAPEADAGGLAEARMRVLAMVLGHVLNLAERLRQPLHLALRAVLIHQTLLAKHPPIILWHERKVLEQLILVLLQIVIQPEMAENLVAVDIAEFEALATLEKVIVVLFRQMAGNVFRIVLGDLRTKFARDIRPLGLGRRGRRRR